MRCAHCLAPMSEGEALEVTVRATGEVRRVHRPVGPPCFGSVGPRSAESIAQVVPPPPGWWRDLGPRPPGTRRPT